jgi:hypothetical protein
MNREPKSRINSMLKNKNDKKNSVFFFKCELEPTNQTLKASYARHRIQ